MRRRRNEDALHLLRWYVCVLRRRRYRIDAGARRKLRLQHNDQLQMRGATGRAAARRTDSLVDGVALSAAACRPHAAASERGW